MSINNLIKNNPNLTAEEILKLYYDDMYSPMGNEMKEFIKQFKVGDTYQYSPRNGVSQLFKIVDIDEYELSAFIISIHENSIIKIKQITDLICFGEEISYSDSNVNYTNSIHSIDFICENYDIVSNIDFDSLKQEILDFKLI